MKRFVFWFIAALVAFSVLRHHRKHEQAFREPTHSQPVVIHRVVPHGTRQPVYYVEDDKGSTYTSLRPIQNRYGDRIVFAFGDDDDDDQGWDSGSGRVTADGLPVPIVPGSRVTEARPEPPKPPKAAKPVKVKVSKRSTPPKRPVPPRPPAPPIEAVTETQTVTGRLSATEDRAQKDAETLFTRMLVEKLSPQIPGSWTPPKNLVRKMILETSIKPNERDYGTVYEATLKVDVSPARRAEVVSAYHHQQVLKRLGVLGGGLLFVLTCLGAVSSYIRSDEATKGYYTNALRLAAAGSVGAAGWAIYRVLA